jgi:hypothetical protein
VAQCLERRVPAADQAAIQFQARAYPAIIDGGNVVKGRVLGPDPDGTKRERADRIAQHMTWQFLNDVPGWEEDTDKLLLQLPIGGCVFRKTWRDPIRNQNNSETVSAKDFVVHNDTVSLEKAPRFTHVQRYYPHEIEAFIRSGTVGEGAVPRRRRLDPHSLVELYEQHRLIDMDEDGLPEPYVVTCTPMAPWRASWPATAAEDIFLRRRRGKQVDAGRADGHGSRSARRATCASSASSPSGTSPSTASSPRPTARSTTSASAR